MSNLVGHILSIRFGRNPIHLPVIAQYSKNGLVSYVTPLWNEASKRFTEYREDSYFLQSGRASFSKQAFPMSEQHKAASRAFRLGMLLKKSARRLQRAKAFDFSEAAITAQKSHAGQWGFWAESSPVFVDESPRMAEIQALHDKLDGMFRAEMELAGIII